MMEEYSRIDYTDDSNWDEDYDMLQGPNGFECLLTEPEDRRWYRDGQPVIDELNRLLIENNRLKELLKEATNA